MANTNETAIGLAETLDASVMHLLHRASQIAEEHVKAELARLKVTPRQYALMAAIDESPGATQVELVALTGIDKSTMAEMTRRLVVPKLIEKSLQDGDSRASSLKLTSSGKRLLKQCRSAAAAGEAEFLGRLPPSRRTSLMNVLRAVIGGQKSKGRAPGADAKAAAEPVKPSG